MTLTASAQESVEPEDEAATTASVTGLITREADPDGQVTYYVVPSEGDSMPLRFGPPWFWGPSNPLDALVGQTVTLDGQLSEAIPDKDASEVDLEVAPEGPSLLVVTADGTPLRQRGKPPWAGGPKVVGEVHPGYAGWNKNDGTTAGEEGVADE